MRLALAHARAETLNLARYPAYSVPTVALPATLLLLFGRTGCSRGSRRRRSSRWRSSSSGSASPPDARCRGRRTCARCR